MISVVMYEEVLILVCCASGSFDVNDVSVRIQRQNSPHKDTRGFKVVWSTMPTSTDERESF